MTSIAGYIWNAYSNGNSQGSYWISAAWLGAACAGPLELPVIAAHQQGLCSWPQEADLEAARHDPMPGKAATRSHAPRMRCAHKAACHAGPFLSNLPSRGLRLHEEIPDVWHLEVDGKEKLFCDPEHAASGIRKWINRGLAGGKLRRRPGGKRSHQTPAQPLIITGFTKVCMLQTSPQTHRPDASLQRASMTSAAVPTGWHCACLQTETPGQLLA